MTSALVVGAASVGCGKKGPPLAPIVHIPAAVERIAARRKGTDVVVTLTVPATNIDGSMPADVGRVEVYGYTGLVAPQRARFLEVATLVGTVTVLPPPLDTAAPAPTAVVQLKPGEATQGSIVSLQDSLTAEALVPKPIPVVPRTGRGAPPPVLTGVNAPRPESGFLRRFYLALAFSPRGRPGPPGPVAELPLTLLPDAPLLTATHTADAVVLEWEPAGGLIGFVLERPLQKEPTPLDDTTLVEATRTTAGDVPDGPTHYNVYREIAAATDLVPEPPPAPIELVNGAVPLDTLTYTDALPLLDGRERCYTVRAVRGSGTNAVEGEPSARICVTPTDDFPPAAPAGLSATSAEGVINLVWEPNADPDLAGYLVLRGEAGDATLAPVTDTVVTDARFADRTVRPGARYVYAVQAIDTHLPRPNVSAESARVEETAR